MSHTPAGMKSYGESVGDKEGEEVGRGEVVGGMRWCEGGGESGGVCGCEGGGESGCDGGRGRRGVRGSGGRGGGRRSRRIECGVECGRVCSVDPGFGDWEGERVGEWEGEIEGDVEGDVVGIAGLEVGEVLGLFKPLVCRENIVLHDLDDRYPHGIQHQSRRSGWVE